ncbi:SAF domain-containing protein [Nocardioides yefusunii]|uniref:SAF domain-containing protein n=1 Tax=Nocardioides yefusunii TaxID=2500546 RepID=A0ABW1QZR4_9ACTN|nr:SAF domain-containing protein [Nocardioides yefusunii]
MNPTPSTSVSSARLARARALATYHRRWIAGACVAAALWTGLGATASQGEDGTAVVVAAQDLPAGTRLDDVDLASTRFAEDQVPDGALVLDDVRGRTLASPLRRGEPVTDARLLSPGLTEHVPGRSVVPVRLGDPDVAALLRVGDVVELWAVDPRGVGHRSLSSAARVVAVVPASARRSGGDAGPLVALAVAPGEAGGVAAAGGDGSIRVVLTS